MRRILTAFLCIISCMISFSCAEAPLDSSVNIKIEPPEESKYFNTRYALFIYVENANYKNYVTVYSPQNLVTIPAVPTGQDINIYALMLPLDPIDTADTDTEELPYYGSIQYKSVSQYTESITLKLKRNILDDPDKKDERFRAANGGKFYYIRRDYKSWDEVHVFDDPDTATDADPAEFTLYANIDARVARILVAGGGGAGGGVDLNGGYGGGGGAAYVFTTERKFIGVAPKEYSVIVGYGGEGADGVAGGVGGLSRFWDSASSPPSNLLQQPPPNPLPSDWPEDYMAYGGGGGGANVTLPGSNDAPLLPAFPWPAPNNNMDEYFRGSGGGGGASNIDSYEGGRGRLDFIDGGWGVPPFLSEGKYYGGAGGGGGMTSVGLAANIAGYGRGGEGLSSDITGAAVVYGKGGAGGSADVSAAEVSAAETATIGSGGDGASAAGTGGDGGDGIVIIRFPYIAPWEKTN